jgi:thiol-disulfide isomerase/thioredoxin
MSRTRRFITACLCAAVTASVLLPSFIQADPAAKPAAKAEGRSLDVIDGELKAAGAKFKEVVPQLSMIGDASFRKDNAEKALPPLKKLAELLGEIAATQEAEEKQFTQDFRLKMLAMGVALGDKDSAKSLNEAATDKDPQMAIAAKSALAFGNWINTSGDAKAQAAVLADYTALAKANPKEDKIAETLFLMSKLGGANGDLSKQAIAVISENLTGEAAMQINSQTAALNKAIVIAGRTVANAAFTSTSMKGKVVLVDFWATWCGPCKEQLPALKKLYADYHGKGLEIVGVSCDSDDAKVTAFTKQNEMPWVQLRELSQNDRELWHPVATKFGVEQIPAMFLVDKKGVLRHIDGEEDMENKVKALLAEADEPAKAPAAPAPTAAPAPAPAPAPTPAPAAK